MKIILCIDDDNMVLNALKSELKSYFSPEYVIEVAESGAEALELVAFFVKNEDDVPLVITDYIMPNMRGDEVLKQVGDLLPNTLGIMLSGQADLNGVRNAIRYGRLQSFILKPWDSADLIGNIKKTLNLHEQGKKIKQQNKNLLDINNTLEQKIESKIYELTLKNKVLKEEDAKFRRIVLDLADANHKLEKSNQEKDDLMAIVAHDLRTPLNNIGGLLDLINTTAPLNTEQLEYMGLITEVIQKGNQLIQDLHVVNNYETDKINIASQPIHLQNMLENLSALFKSASQEKEIVIHVEISEDIVLRTDEGLLSRILTNLLSNAIKFSPRGKCIFIRALLDKKCVKIQIEDEGQGFTKEDQAKVFQKFQKLTARPTAGESSTGLGLSIVKILVEKLGGEIVLESEWGRGSTFTLTFLGASTNLVA